MKKSILPLLVLAFVSIKGFAFQHKHSDSAKIIHVAVALCDNKQHIAKVPDKLGKGDDLKNNLYWGALYGVKTFFTKSANWQLIKSDKKCSSQILERVVFKHKTQNCYLIADAYHGDYIYQTIKDIINFSANTSKQTLTIEGRKYPIAGESDLIVYVGHNGMLDSDFPEFQFPNSNKNNKDAMVLACYSNCKFEEPFLKSNTNFVLGTNGLVAPEAYILENALEAWLKNKSKLEIEIAAASAYAKYQNISQKAANRIFVTSK